MDDIRPHKPRKKLTLQRNDVLPGKAPPFMELPPEGPSLLTPAPSKSSWKKWLIGIILALIGLIIVVAVSGFFWYKDALGAKSVQEAGSIKFEIQPGAAADQVADELEQKGLIKSGLAAIIYMRTQNTDIKAGEYLISPSQTLVEIVRWLNEGKINTMEYTILPGQTIDQLKQSFRDFGFSQDEIDAAFSKDYKHPIFKGKPANSSLEGYIFPETYFISSDSNVEDILKTSFDEFNKQLKADNLSSKLAKRGFSLWKAIILASLIEREVKSAEDQRRVAQVLEKRLSDDMRLDIDATYEYAAKQLGVAASPDLDSPYNTRLHSGLPPGPISNFNLSALNAVADPAPGSYLYYVTGDDGINRFSKTLEEHEANIQQYCQQLCSN